MFFGHADQAGIGADHEHDVVRQATRQATNGRLEVALSDK